MSFLCILEKKKQKEQSEKDKQQRQGAPLISEGKNHLIELFVYITRNYFFKYFTFLEYILSFIKLSFT